MIISKNDDRNVLPTDVIGRSVAHSKRWLVAIVRIHHEKKTSERLTKMGVENFLPIQQEVHNWSDRRKVVDRVILPMMIFVHVDPQEQKRSSDLIRYQPLHGTTWGEYSGCNSRPTNVTIQIYARLFGRNDLYEHIAISAGRKNTCNKGAIGRTGRGTGRYEWEIKSRRPTDNVGMCVCRYTGRMCGAGLVLSIEFKNSD